MILQNTSECMFIASTLRIDRRYYIQQFLSLQFIRKNIMVTILLLYAAPSAFQESDSACQ